MPNDSPKICDQFVRETKLATRSAAKIAIECLGDRLGEFAAQLQKGDAGEFARMSHDPVQFAALRAEAATEKAAPRDLDLADEPGLPIRKEAGLQQLMA